MYEYPAQVSILYDPISSGVSTFVIDPAWDKIVYGEYGSSVGYFKHPYSITVLNWGDMYVADTGNGRQVNL